ncbi:GH36-type glycosyl hydrolase domain-containing protein [Falsirhodobacter sp. 1013]|uniref:GH36-type glycosyl hydrolase domain-containing protein n=1 Tax=Falsirhodobacter sp. 1013 TaxID=3417566 RepID=UPI003EBC645F
MPDRAFASVECLPPIRHDRWNDISYQDAGQSVLQSTDLHLLAFQPFALPARLIENRTAVRRSYLALLAAAEENRVISPAAVWLIDNHHIADETFRHLRRDLRPAAYHALPTLRLASGEDVPRILALVWIYVAKANSDTTLPTLTSIVEGMQRGVDLTIAEVWAVPALLRFVLLENLRRLSDRVAQSHHLRGTANELADRLALASPAEVPALLALSSHATRHAAFAAQLAYRTSAMTGAMGPALVWLEAQLHAAGETVEQVVASEHVRQAATNVTMGNILRSLRLIDEVDWLSWFETVAVVCHTLREAEDYARLDKDTRNVYRETIERLARRSPLTEVGMAKLALDLSEGADPGPWLLGDRLPELRRAAAYRPSPKEHVQALWRRTGWVGLAAPVGLGAAAIAALMIWTLTASLGVLGVLFLLALLPASEAATALLHRAVGWAFPPARLPSYDFSRGIPERARTLVVIPCLLSSRDEIDALLRNIELHYLSNSQGAIDFALLSDWTDCAEPHRADDGPLLGHATGGIDALAARYSATGRRFFLLHRRRIHNAREGVWMGWERKRGKLVELNALLRGDPDTSFLPSGPRPPASVRFVMTLDSDTRLLRDSVAALAGKLAHPVNRPVADVSGRVVGGHAILQPRVTPSLTTGREASLFQRMFSAHRGLDPYVFTVSDTYQDFAGEGSFTGKGLYDIDAFAAATEGRMPENTVLSHDLLEGSFARAALVTDVQVVEDFPIAYHVDAARQHRWMRGDWQLLPFILSPGNGIGGLGRFKMVDNLRRALLPVTWIAASVGGWLTLSAGDAVRWQGLLVLVLLLGPLCSFLSGVLPGHPSVPVTRHGRTLILEAFETFGSFILRLAFLPHQALLSVDALIRSLYRMRISHENLLEWRSNSQVVSSVGVTFWGHVRMMAVAPMLAFATVALVAVVNPPALELTTLFALIWLTAPLTAWATSRTMETQDRLILRPGDAASLRRTARITWRFFETFVTPATHHLPPDNYQDDPAPKLAERTSPSNIGLYMLSVLSARDFGWISLTDAVIRIEDTLSTVERMEKHRGHLFNWYDTRDLSVLSPRYVSSVDSGNLAGHLVTLGSALREWAASSIVHVPSNPQGIGDVLDVLRMEFAAIPDDRRSLRPLRRRLEEGIDGFAASHALHLSQPQLAAVHGASLLVIAADIRRLVSGYAAECRHDSEILWWAETLHETCEAAIYVPDPAQMQARMWALGERARALAFGMDFGFLKDPERNLLSIGYRVEASQLDESCYDLLASEARLASLFAIAKGDLPNTHWFRLGRPIAALGPRGTLLSWSGSMFEYLMPPLVMRETLGGILHASTDGAVGEQIAYGRARGVPWGISESAFNGRDLDMNYQYYAFGVPALALKRTVSDDLVVAPYASLLASQFRPREAVRNLSRLAQMGALGPYGFYDAVDFTAGRLPEGASQAVVRNVMAHHQGMSIVAVANTVLEGIHRDRFHNDPVIEAAELLLQEKAPREIVPVTRPAEGRSPAGQEVASGGAAQTVVAEPALAGRAVTLLSNGRYAKMVTAAGAGSSRRGTHAVTRWRPDPTLDRDGLFFFLRDTESHHWWSTTTTPRPAPGEKATTTLSDHKAEFFKTAHGIESVLECIVASEADAEGHRLTLRNRSARTRSIEVTSYGEIVLDLPAADHGHPAFSKMFVRTTIASDLSMVTARRNARGQEPVLHLAHLLCGGGTDPQAETDRRAFIGRGRRLGNAVAFDPAQRLSGGDGFTLDPVFALRRTVRIHPGAEVTLTYWTLVAEDEAALASAVRHYADPAVYDHENRLAWTRSQVQLRHIDSTLEEAAVFRAYAAVLIYPDGKMGIRDRDIADAVAPQSALWGFGISGDCPIFVLRIDTPADLAIAREAMRMMLYFRHRGVAADLVILNDRASSYTQDLQNALVALRESFAHSEHEAKGREHVFVLRQDQVEVGALRGLLATARVVLHTRNGTLGEQLARMQPEIARPPLRLNLAPPVAAPHATPAFPKERLAHFNGYGGFSADGREYVTRLRHGQATPHPWINVIARDGFGGHISAEGAGFTWAANSRDYQITPWSNDPVENRMMEGIVLRDRDGGRLFTPFAGLSTDPGAIFEARHGMGYSGFRSWTDALDLDAVQVLLSSGPAKLTRLRVTNKGARQMELECLGYAELILGNDRGRTAPSVRVERKGDALIARNPASVEFPGRAMALACNRPVADVQACRQAVFGKGDLSRPDALVRWPAMGGTDGDPCAALLVRLTLAPGETTELVFALADAPEADLPDVLARAMAAGAVEEAMTAAGAEWKGLLDTLQVKTPDPKLDLMVNTWLPYQSLACRIRARTAFYQASGAFGFRDQLQDTSAMILQDPALCRRQILNAAGRQFPEGDVQHWWLPATGAGVRTMISDDVVWLGHITERYLRMTGDAAILDEPVSFLNGPHLEPGQHDAFFAPESGGVASLYEHCALALDLAVARTGRNGLPLILGGDWNDGMNRVGEAGQGESVWMAWFLAATLDSFIPLAKERGDVKRAALWQAHRVNLTHAVDAAGWDGGWYRRGYFDDGTPLGSATQGECRIDSIAQSWAAISGAGRQDRVDVALDAALAHLQDREAGILRLFSPPFEQSPMTPGYIKAYPPGVRENGGQYTHAAAWMIYALARRDRGTDAHQLFDLLNPISHSATPEAAERYRVEPYVMAADIYGEGLKTGRGGWTWYTGSAGWMYRAAVEGILGITLEGGTKVRVTPALPSHWPGFNAILRREGHEHHIEVSRKDGEVVVTLDGELPNEHGAFVLKVSKAKSA